VRASPNRENVVDWRASPWVGGGRNGNNGGQKRAEDHDGSVTGVDKRREEEGSVRRSCGRGWRRVRGEGKRREHGTAAGSF
jgi:hypothetical protein